MDWLGGKEGWSSDHTRRACVLTMAILVGIASGSNYGYSAYAPQLASKLSISSTQVNLIGTAGNLGMYAMGPVLGKLIDARGQQLPLLLGSISIFTGYFTVYSFFNESIPLRNKPIPNNGTDTDTDTNTPPSIIGLSLLCFAMFLTGSGGSAGLSASVNAIAKSFSDTTRASATGLVFAGFGLSAFTFSTIGHLIFPGDAGGLLLLLAIGTSLPIFIGSFIIKPIPPSGSSNSMIGYGNGSGSEYGYQPISTIHSPEILGIDQDHHHHQQQQQHHHQSHLSRSQSTSLELTRSLSPRTRHTSRLNLDSNDDFNEVIDEQSDSESLIYKSRNQDRNVRALSSSSNTDTNISMSVSPMDIHITPYQLLFNTDFRCLFTVLALLCGCGLMYINNVGTVALALARQGKIEFDPKVIGAWQAKQVATISVWNCLGRVLGGEFGISRVWFLPIVATLFILAQLSALNAEHVETLWMVSTNLGLAYGSLFNVVPMLVLEWFGMSHFSQNWGWINLGPVIGGNVFNLIFGRVYDSNTMGRIGLPENSLESISELIKRTLSPEDRHACLLGEDCYGTAFRITALGCTIALIISIAVGIRREKESNRYRRALIEGDIE